MKLEKISFDKARLFEELMGLEKNVLDKEPFKEHVFQSKHSLVFYSGDLSEVEVIDPVHVGVVFAEWMGSRSLRVFPSAIPLFSEFFQNIVSTDFPYFVNGRNLPPNSFKWVLNRSDSRRVLVRDVLGTPLGIGLKKPLGDGGLLLINEVSLGDFLKKEKKAKRKFR